MTRVEAGALRPAPTSLMMTAAATPSLARIPAGEFLMGAADAAGDERPVHRVYVEEFFIGRFPVTNEDYARFVRATGHPAPAVRTLPRIGAAEREELFKELSAPYEWDGGNPPHGREGHPVVLVRYDDCASYCRWLSDELGRAVRMPTDAEWEKAARGGLEGRRYPWGDEIDASRCNYLADGGKKTNSSTKPAGTYPPNGYGLFEMAGNVWEWVTDWYDPGYRAADGARDPQGPPVGSMRLVRGGSWVCENVDMLRCAYRHRVPDDTYAPSIGFRIVCPR